MTAASAVLTGLVRLVPVHGANERRTESAIAPQRLFRKHMLVERPICRS